VARSVPSATKPVKVTVAVLLVVSVALALTALVFHVRTDAAHEWLDWLDALGLVMWLAIFSVVGALIVLHRPDNVIGWLCLCFALFWSIWIAGDAILVYDEANPGTLASPGALAASIHPLWVPAIGIIGLLLLLFPDGRLPSVRWRPVLWGLLFVIGTLTITAFFLPGLVQDRTVVNPWGVEAFEVFDTGPAGRGLVVLLILGIVLSALSVIFRYRSAGTLERFQLKWLMAAAVVSAISYILLFFVGDMPIQLIFSLIPIAIWFAVRRHRLYEIDRVISRTVAYGLVVATLAAVYAGAVFVLQGLVKGGDSLVVAASTLVVAGIFNPVRRRTLARVDRFFNRSHYDAERVVNVFANELRNETDAERIVLGWTRVAAETMEPSAVGVWTRSETPPKLSLS
jgi:hypothetical protein